MRCVKAQSTIIIWGLTELINIINIISGLKIYKDQLQVKALNAMLY